MQLLAVNYNCWLSSTAAGCRVELLAVKYNCWLSSTAAGCRVQLLAVEYSCWLSGATAGCQLQLLAVEYSCWLSMTNCWLSGAAGGCQVQLLAVEYSCWLSSTAAGCQVQLLSRTPAVCQVQLLPVVHNWQMSVNPAEGAATAAGQPTCFKGSLLKNPVASLWIKECGSSGWYAMQSRSLPGEGGRPGGRTLLTSSRQSSLCQSLRY